MKNDVHQKRVKVCGHSNQIFFVPDNFSGETFFFFFLMQLEGAAQNSLIFLPFLLPQFFFCFWILRHVFFCTKYLLHTPDNSVIYFIIWVFLKCWTKTFHLFGFFFFMYISVGCMWVTVIKENQGLNINFSFILPKLQAESLFSSRWPLLCS